MPDATEPAASAAEPSGSPSSAPTMSDTIKQAEDDQSSTPVDQTDVFNTGAEKNIEVSKPKDMESTENGEKPSEEPAIPPRGESAEVKDHQGSVDVEMRDVSQDTKEDAQAAAGSNSGAQPSSDPMPTATDEDARASNDGEPDTAQAAKKDDETSTSTVSGSTPADAARTAEAEKNDASMPSMPADTSAPSEETSKMDIDTQERPSETTTVAEKGEGGGEPLASDASAATHATTSVSDENRTVENGSGPATADDSKQDASASGTAGPNAPVEGGSSSQSKDASSAAAVNNTQDKTESTLPNKSTTTESDTVVPASTTASAAPVSTEESDRPLSAVAAGKQPEKATASGPDGEDSANRPSEKEQAELEAARERARALQREREERDRRKDELFRKKDKKLAELLLMLDDYRPLIPDEVTDHYLQKAGFECDDVRLKRLLSLAAQKFVSDIATDAFEYAKIRGSGAGTASNSAAANASRTVLTMDDLNLALNDHGVNAKKPDYYF